MAAEITEHDEHMPHDGNGHEQPTEEQAPETTPERPARTPKPDAIADIVETHDLFVGVISLADDALTRFFIAKPAAASFFTAASAAG